MKQLDTADYSLALPLLRSAPFYTGFAESVLLRQTSGVVYVDCADSPQLVYICLPFGMSILVSSQLRALQSLNALSAIHRQKDMQRHTHRDVNTHEEKESLNEIEGEKENNTSIAKEEDMEKDVENHDIEKEKEKEMLLWLTRAFKSKKFGESSVPFEFLQAWPPMEWKEILLGRGGLALQEHRDSESDEDSYFPPVHVGPGFPSNTDKVVLCERVIYQFVPTANDIASLQRNEKIAAGYQIVPINEAFFRISPDVFSLRPDMFWKDYAAWNDNHAAGFVAIAPDSSVACIAFSAFCIGDSFEIGVECAVAHRNMGLARMVCKELVKHCVKNCITPVWTCRRGNMGSEKIATSLGFKETKFDFGPMPYYYLPLTL